MAARPESTGRTIGDLAWLRLGDIEPLAVTFKVAEKISGLGPTSLWKAANQSLPINPPARYLPNFNRLSLFQKFSRARASSHAAA
jgi:hypothetical protein